MKRCIFCTMWIFLCREPSAPAGLTRFTLCAGVNQTAQPGQKGPPERLTLVCFDPLPAPASAAVTRPCVLLDSRPLSSTSSFASHNWTFPRLQLCPSGNRSIQTSSSIPARGGKKKMHGFAVSPLVRVLGCQLYGGREWP